jgi:single-stranded DNA-specific DHH superfamily exonuclease
MKQKPLTRTIATMLAQKVRQELTTKSMTHSEQIKVKALSSKEFKEYKKVADQIAELQTKRKLLKDAVTAKYSSEIAETYIYEYGTSAEIRFREQNKVSVDGIRDMLLLEDYFNNSSVTPEEMVDKMVTKLLTIKK